MRGFSIKFLFVLAALFAALATAQKAESTDLTKPSFLVATRDLEDPNFARSVVLMVPSSEPPLLAGVIINNPGKQRIQDVFPQARQLKGAGETVYIGGPVEPDEVSVVFRAPSGAIGSASKVFDDTYVATSQEAVAAVLKDPRITDLRVIQGKAQWLRDQLNSEVMEGSWYIVPAKAELVFSDPKDLWSTLVKGGDLEEAEASLTTTVKLPYRRCDATNWQRLISPN
jgi:putative transcriptional regulator